MPFGERKEELSSLIAFTSGATVPFTNGVPRDLPLTRLMAILEGRMTISAQTVAGTIFPEAPATLVRRIELRGTKATGGGQTTLVNARGEELNRITRFYHQYLPLGPDVADAAGAGGTAFPAPLAATANGSFDFRVAYMIPIAYDMASVEDESVSILDPSIFSQLDLFVSFGTGQANFVSGGTLTFALSAFGSATGNPVMRITRFSPLAVSHGFKDLINRFHVQTISKQKNLSSIGVTFNDTKIDDLNVGNRIRSVLLRQYQENTTVAGQMDVIAAANGALIGDNSNPGVFRWRVKVNGGEKMRWFNPDAREWNRQVYKQYSTLIPQGYTNLEFAQRGFPLSESFDLRGFGAAGARYELFADALSVPATVSRLDILQQEQIPVEV